ncbi:hypothetical protein SAMN05421839_12125 [Halolactibacillus halophilus]|uniref:RiboL-PSP-HEPN domain-containing protein n=1 Tax=Halolactibacillus halophilus TaxID=306540 RepID=A0A1I5QG13_9BACI|nr:hypothetical protein [Halolactibacillus halophilus]GEM02116.1 hypothetical protein HHA03_16480 [Halolactibacillus halophilus]SFP45067.1 hypothetical protein SAMN05421839_12125 [Halolactibacillus halophilus]
MAIEFKDRSEIYNDLITSVAEKESLIFNYEEKEVYELAYLIKWQIVEDAVKEIGKLQRKENLMIKLNEWIKYLNADSKKQPKIINSFRVDLDSIPNEELIKQFFSNGRLPNLYDLLKSKGKYRNRRNDIAHRFSKFRNQSKYKEYSIKVDAAINELIESLKI